MILRPAKGIGDGQIWRRWNVNIHEWLMFCLLRVKGEKMVKSDMFKKYSVNLWRK